MTRITDAATKRGKLSSAEGLPGLRHKVLLRSMPPLPTGLPFDEEGYTAREEKEEEWCAVAAVAVARVQHYVMLAQGDAP